LKKKQNKNNAGAELGTARLEASFCRHVDGEAEVTPTPATA
jgi:hypothetical protein